MHAIPIHSETHLHCTLARLIEWATPILRDGRRIRLSWGDEQRSTEQNARMWAMLGEVSRQVEWHGQRLTGEEWKDVFSAALNRQKVVPGIDGGFVVIGARTSKMSKRELSDIMELISAFGAERGVRFTEPEHAE